MRFATTLAAASVVALCFGSAYAAEKAKSTDPGFNNLDRNHDGKLTRSEAARNPYLEKRFKEADRDGDGTLSRTEYLRVMTAKDMGTVKDKVTGKKEESSASAGSSAKSGSSKSTSKQ